MGISSSAKASASRDRLLELLIGLASRAVLCLDTRLPGIFPWVNAVGKVAHNVEIIVQSGKLLICRVLTGPRLRVIGRRGNPHFLACDLAKSLEHSRLQTTRSAGFFDAPDMRPTQALLGPLRRRALTTKRAGKGYYKGTGSGSMGRHTKHGGYIVELAKVRTYVVPATLADFKVLCARGMRSEGEPS